MFQSMLNAYETGLKWVLKHQFFTLTRLAVATLVATVWLYIIVPKGLLPQQDTGLITGVTDAGQTISFKAMVERQRVYADIVKSRSVTRTLAKIREPIRGARHTGQRDG